MKIITFGSCLSRLTAQRYIRIFGGEVISSVFHNRSDCFLGRFVDRTESFIPYEDLLTMLVPASDEGGNPDDNSTRLVANQYEQFLGLHRLTPGVQVFEALQQPDVGLIIFDNFNDLRARMLRLKSNPNIQVFLRPKDFKDPEAWELGPELDPVEGAKAMSRILHLFKQLAPQAAVTFINLPHNTYSLRGGTSAKADQIIAYEQALDFDQGLIIPCAEIRPSQQTADPQHFTSDQYAAYAGWIQGYIASQKAAKS